MKKSDAGPAGTGNSGQNTDRGNQIDPLKIDALAIYGASDIEIAAILHVPVEELRREYGTRIKEAELRGTSLVRRKAFEVAVSKGDPRMLSCLLAHRAGLGKDARLEELRDLQLEEQKVKLERARLQLKEEQQIDAAREKQRAKESGRLEEEEKQLERQILIVGIVLMALELRENSGCDFFERLEQCHERLQQMTPDEREEWRHREDLLIKMAVLEHEEYEDIMRVGRS